MKHLQRLKKKLKSGFTLAETLIVVTIIVILSLLILLLLSPKAQIFKGFDTRRKTDLNKLQNIMEEYYSDHGSYPPASALDHCGSADLQPYITAIPCDPNTHTPYKRYFLAGVNGTDDTPQQYAIYAPVDSLGNSTEANEIPNCPNTIAVHSPGFTQIDLIKGCSGISSCHTYYGCQNGACVIVSQENLPACSPNTCDSDCGGTDCSKRDSTGTLTNECMAI